jgi:hypothetical protein
MAKWRVPTSDSSSVALKDKEHVAHVSKHSENPSCNLPPPDRRYGAGQTATPGTIGLGDWGGIGPDAKGHLRTPSPVVP